MNNLPKEPIEIGHALLSDNKLTVGGSPYELRHNADFDAFVRTTSAVVATALSTAFGVETGSLIFTAEGDGKLECRNIEPWEQYTSAVQGFNADPSLAKVITGWCTLLCLQSHFFPSDLVESKAIAFARYISATGFKAAVATPEAVKQWDDYQVWASSIEGAVARLNGTVDDPLNPWRDAVDLCLPAPPGLSHLTALTLVDAFGGDIVVSPGKACASAGPRHLISCVDDVSHIKRPGDFGVSLLCGGVERRFRVHSNGDYMCLRLQGSALPEFNAE